MSKLFRSHKYLPMIQNRNFLLFSFEGRGGGEVRRRGNEANVYSRKCTLIALITVKSKKCRHIGVVFLHFCFRLLHAHQSDSAFDFSMFRSPKSVSIVIIRNGLPSIWYDFAIINVRHEASRSFFASRSPAPSFSLSPVAAS